MRSKTTSHLSRRSLMKGVVGTSAAALLPIASPSGAAQNSPPGGPLDLPVLSSPDRVVAFVGEIEATSVELSKAGPAWQGTGPARALRMHFSPAERSATISLESPSAPVQRLHLRWSFRLPQDVRALGDAWERSYGDLEWRPLQAERAMPWYVMLQLRGQTAGMGVKTGAASLAFWQVDPMGISLWLDVRNGSNGVQLGPQVLDLATIVTHQGAKDESAISATRALCRRMAQGTRIPQSRGATSVGILYGSNDWYYAYGNNTPAGILRDAELVRSLAPSGPHRPFTVIDDGYQDPRRFPDMARLAAEIRHNQVIPGLWIRPLRASAETPRSLLLPAQRWIGEPKEQPLAFDPTIPEALAAIAAVARQACAWGFDLIKHDFTTFELFGQWGSQMGASPTQGNWHFNDRSLTNAQIVTLLYRQLRAACGEDKVILGCNTIGHLSVGLFDASRTGDDVSGRQWERTRRLGVNTLAFRLPQHKTFFSLDADCVPLTRDIPWSMTRQWLAAVASTGTVLLISAEPGAIGDAQRAALRDAFSQCVQQAHSEPLDWLESRTPAQWTTDHQASSYNWTLDQGESPFTIGIQRGPD